MRGFFILLLLTNLLFIAWQVWLQPKREEPPPYAGTTLSNEGLPLLAELKDEEQPPLRSHRSDTSALTEAPELVEPEVRDDVPAASALSATSVCFQSGPLASREELVTLQQQLAEIGIEETERKSIEIHRRNFWVMLPPYASREQAKEAAQILREQKVKDFFIVASGQYENAVSLGVYSSRERAEQRYQRITKLKARLRKPQIEGIELPAKRTVLTFQLPVGSEPYGLQSLLTSGQEGGIEKIPCK